MASQVAANAVFQNTHVGSVSRNSVAVTSSPDPAGDWLMPPISKAEMASRVGVSVDKFELMFRNCDLQRHENHRQLWTMRLDKADPKLARMLQTPVLKANGKK